MILLKAIAATTALAAFFLTSGCKEKKDPTKCPVCGVKATFTNARGNVTVYGHYVDPEGTYIPHTWTESR